MGKCTEKRITETDLQGLDLHFGIGNSVEDFVSKFTKTKEEDMAALSLITTIGKDEDAIVTGLEKIRNRNALGDVSVADKVFALNNDQPLYLARNGVESDSFFKLFDFYLTQAMRFDNVTEATFEQEADAWNKAYKTKAKLFTIEVNNKLGGYLTQNSILPKLRADNILDQNNDPIVFTTTGDTVLKKLIGETKIRNEYPDAGTIYLRGVEEDIVIDRPEFYGLNDKQKSKLIAKMNRNKIPTDALDTRTELSTESFADLNNIDDGMVNSIHQYLLRYLHNTEYVIIESQVKDTVSQHIKDVRAKIAAIKSGEDKGSVVFLKNEELMLVHMYNNMADVLTGLKEKYRHHINQRKNNKDTPFDQDPTAIDPIINSSKQVRLFFLGLPLRADNNGLYFYDSIDPMLAQYTVLNMLNGTKNTMAAKLDRLREQSQEIWLDELIKRLESAPIHIQNLFSKELNKTYTNINYVLEKTIKGQTKMIVVNSNRSTNDIHNQWKRNFINSNIFKPSVKTGGYTINIENINEVIKDFEDLKNILSPTVDQLKINKKLNQHNKLKAFNSSKVDDLFWSIGVVLDNEHTDEFVSGKYKLGDELITAADVFKRGHIFDNILNKLTALKNVANYKSSISEDDIYVLRDEIRTLASNETKFTSVIPTSGSIVAGNKLYPWQYPSLWYDRFHDLQRDEYNEQLKDDYFVNTGYWFTSGKHKRLSMGVLPGGVLQIQGRKAKDTKITNLSKKDLLKAKMGLFFGNGGGIANDYTHTAMITMPTPGDNSNIETIKYDTVGAIKKNENDIQVFAYNYLKHNDNRRMLSDDALREFFNSSVLGEINRIVKHKNSVSNRREWNSAGHKFIAWPELNNVIINIWDKRQDQSKASDVSDKEVEVRLSEVGQLAATETEKEIGKIIAGESEGSNVSLVASKPLVELLNGDPKLYSVYSEHIHRVIYKDYLSNYFAELMDKVKQDIFDTKMIVKGTDDNGNDIYSIDNVDADAWGMIRDVVGIVNVDSDGTVEDHINAYVMYYVFNQELASANINQLFVGDPVHYYEGNTDINSLPSENYKENAYSTLLNMLKRQRGNNTPRKTVNELAVGDKIGLMLIKEPKEDSGSYDYYKNVLKLDEDKLKYYKDINSMDAQEYITVKTMLTYMLAHGEITEQEFNDEYNHYKDTGKLLNPKLRIGFTKDVYTGEVWDATIKTRVPVYIKSGTTVLYPPAYDGSSQWMKLIKEMEALEERSDTPQHIHLIPKSALKVGTPAHVLEDLFVGGKLNENVFSNEYVSNMMEIPSRYRGRQTEIPNKDDNYHQALMTLPSQLKQYIMVDMIDKSGFMFKGEPKNGKELFAEYLDIIERLFNSNLKDTEDSEGYYSKTGRTQDGVFNDRNGRPDTRKFVTFLRDRLSDMAEDLEEINIDPERLAINEETGEFIEPIFETSDKYLEILVRSILNKVFFDLKIEGNSFSVISAHQTVFDQPQFSDNIWVDPKKVQTLTGPSAGKTSVDVMLSSKLTDNKGNILDLFEKDKNGQYRWITFDPEFGYVLNKDMREVKEIFNTLAYRIPSPHHGYFVDINVVGFLPESMDVIMPAVDIVPKTGGDFDADKLFVFMQNHKIVNGKMILENKDKKKMIHNDMIQMFKTVLANPSPAVQKIIYTPVDNPNIGRQAKVLSAYSKRPPLKYINSFDTQETLMKQNNSTKDGTSLYAGYANLISQVNVLSKYLNEKISYNIQWYIPKKVKLKTEPIGINFAGYESNGVVGAEKINKITKEGTTIKREAIELKSLMENNSMKLSNALDNGKKQFMQDLNENQYTFNTVIGMMSFGFIIEDGVKIQSDMEESFELIYLLLNQPVVKEYIKLLDYNTSDYDFSNPVNDATYLEMLFPPEIIAKFKDDRKSSVDVETRNNLLSFFKINEMAGKISPQRLMDNIASGQIKGNEEDLSLLGMFLVFNQIGGQLQQVNKFTSIDRKGFPDNFHQMRNYLFAEMNLDEYPYINVRKLIEAKRSTDVPSSKYFGRGVKPFYYPGQGVYKGLQEVGEAIMKGTGTIYGRPVYTKTHDKILNMLGYIDKDVFEKKSLYPTTQDFADIIYRGLRLANYNIAGFNTVGGENLNGLTPIQQLRDQLFFDRDGDGITGNESLGTFINRLKMSNQDMKRNSFINGILVEPNKTFEPTTIMINKDRLNPSIRKELEKGIVDLFNDNTEFEGIRYNGDRMSPRKLVTYFYLYSVLGGDKNFRNDLVSVIPYGIREALNNTKKNIGDKHLAEDITLIENLSLQVVQHQPWRIRQKYYSPKAMEQAGFTFSYNGKPVSDQSAANTAKVVESESTPEMIYFKSKNGEWIWYKENIDNDDNAIYIKLDILGNDQITEFDPFTKYARTQIKRGGSLNRANLNVKASGLIMLRDNVGLETEDILLPGIDLENEFDLGAVTMAHFVISQLPDDNRLRRLIDRNLINIGSIRSEFQNGVGKDEGDAAIYIMEERIGNVIQNISKTYNNLMLLLDVDIETQSIKDVRNTIAYSVTARTLINDIDNLIKASNQYVKMYEEFNGEFDFNPDIFNPVAISKLNNYANTYKRFEELSDQDLYDVEKYIDNNIDNIGSDYVIQKERWDLLRNYVGTLNNIEYFYENFVSDSFAEYIGEFKQINISLKNLFKDNLSTYDVRKYLTRSMLHEVQHHYYSEKIEGYLNERYDSVIINTTIDGDPIYTYVEKEGVTIDPVIQQIVLLFNEFQQNLNIENLSEEDIQEIEKGKGIISHIDFYRATNIDEFIATSYDLIEGEEGLHSVVGIDRFTDFKSYIKNKDGDLGLSLFNQVMQRLSSSGMFGIRNNSFTDGLNNIKKTNC